MASLRLPIAPRIFACFMAFGAVALAAAPAFAAAPSLVNLQGYLRATDGRGLTDAVNLEVNLYAQQTGGAALHTESFTALSVTDGRFKITLGAATALSPSVFTGRDEV